MMRAPGPPGGATVRAGSGTSVQPVDPAVQIAVSHAEFLLVQARQIVNQLAGTKTLDPLLCRQMQSLLDQAQVRPPPTPKRDIAHGEVVKKDAKKDVKGKNKWAREVMADTPLLPTLVDTALSATAGPFLSSAQREAIVDIVGLSQNRIANALTDPERQAAAQRWAQTTAKSAHQGLKGGLAGTSENWDKWYMKQLVDTDTRSQKRKDDADLRDELRHEREPFITGRGGLRAARVTGGPAQVSAFQDNPAVASVACLPSDQMADASQGAVSQAGAVTTTFSPWPGLVLTMSTVASSVTLDHVPDEALDDTSARIVPPPPSQVPPPPPSSSSLAPPPPRRMAAPSSPTTSMSIPPPARSAMAPSMAAHASQPLPPVPPYAPPGQDPRSNVPHSLRPG